MTTQAELTALLSTVIRENRRKSKSAQCTIYKAMLLSDGYEDFLDTALTKVFGLDYKRAHDAVYPPSRTELEERAARRRKERLEDDHEIGFFKGMITGNLLGLMTPIGKELGDCTGLEGRRFGGFFDHIFADVDPDERLRDKFTEDELQAIARDMLLSDATSRPEAISRPMA